jgi:hypothetical protein
MLESAIERRVCAWAVSKGIMALKVSPMGMRGWPDRMFLYLGVVVFIEFKQQGKKATPLQNYRISALKANGFSAEVFDNADKAIAFLGAALLSAGGPFAGTVPGVAGTSVAAWGRENISHLLSHEDAD